MVARATTEVPVARVCAVIVHHRGRALLRRCLESLLASEGVAIDVVIVSNACREPMPEIVEREESVRVVVAERPIGFSAANNLGVEWCLRELGAPAAFFFVNNDTVVATTAVARLVSALDADPRCAVAGPRLMIWRAPGTLNSLGLNVTIDGQAWDEGIGRPLADYGELPAVLDVLAVTGAALMMRASSLERIGGWSELYGYYFEDIDLCLRIRSLGDRCVVVRDAVVEHAISATAERGSDLKISRSWRNRFLLTLVHWPWRLLARTAPTTAVAEARLLWRRLRLRCWHDAWLQLRSWGGAAVRAPAAWLDRRRTGDVDDWVESLRPRGSVPVIELPELPAETLDEAEP